MNDTLYIVKWQSDEAEAKRLAEEEYAFYLKTHPTLKVGWKNITILKRADQPLIGYSIWVWFEPQPGVEVNDASN